MKQFLKVKSPRSLDFYSIYLNDKGEKEIHVYGYTYFGDNWVVADVCWFIQRLTDFVNDMKNDADHINNCYSELKQYEKDCSFDETVERINSYFEGNGADYYLQFADITTETPCGNYVNEWQ